MYTICSVAQPEEGGAATHPITSVIPPQYPQLPETLFQVVYIEKGKPTPSSI